MRPNSSAKAKMSKKQNASKEQALRTLAKKDLYTFIKLKWQRYNQNPYLDNWHIKYVCETLSFTLKDYAQSKGEANITRLMLNMPPSYLKTEIVGRAFPAWALGRDRTRKIIYISYSDELCRKISNQVRDLMKSTFWAQVFGEKPYFLQDNSSEFVLKEGGGLFVTTLKSAITGFHAHSILIDDPIKVSDMSSKVERERVNHNFKESVLSRLQDNFSNITILMQRLGYEDLCGFLLDERNFDASIIKQWHQISLEALNKDEIEYKIGDFSYKRKADEPLFPQRHSKDDLEFLRKQMGEDEFSSQYQQVPQASEAGFFDIANFKLIASYEQNPQNEFIFIDNATSLNVKADNRAIVVVGCEKTSANLTRFVVKDCFFGIWDEAKTCSVIIEAMLKYPKSKVFIEKEGGGETLSRLLNNEIVLVNERLKKQAAPLIANIINLYSANRKISKVEKIKALKPYYNSGHLVFLQNAQGLNQIKKELLAFNPEKPFRKDDCIDALASCVASESVSAPPLKDYTPKTNTRIYGGSMSWRI